MLFFPVVVGRDYACEPTRIFHHFQNWMNSTWCSCTAAELWMTLIRTLSNNALSELTCTCTVANCETGSAGFVTVESLRMAFIIGCSVLTFLPNPHGDCQGSLHCSNSFCGMNKNESFGWCFCLRAGCLLSTDIKHVTVKIWDIGGQTIGGRMLPNYLVDTDVRFCSCTSMAKNVTR